MALREEGISDLLYDEGEVLFRLPDGRFAFSRVQAAVRLLEEIATSDECIPADFVTPQYACSSCRRIPYSRKAYIRYSHLVTEPLVSSRRLENSQEAKKVLEGGSLSPRFNAKHRYGDTPRGSREEHLLFFCLCICTRSDAPPEVCRVF